jgi:hypothetical protein
VHGLAASAASSAGASILALIFIIVGIGAYFVPGIIAQVRHVPNSGSVWIINIFLGWTFVGWIVALAMACRSQLPAQQVIVQQGWQGGGPGTQPYGEAQPQQWGQTQPYPQQSGQQPPEQQPWVQGQ